MLAPNRGGKRENKEGRKERGKKGSGEGRKQKGRGGEREGGGEREVFL